MTIFSKAGAVVGEGGIPVVYVVGGISTALVCGGVKVLFAACTLVF